MSWWEAPSATACAVCPFWGKNRQKMSPLRIRDVCSERSHPDSGSVVLFYLLTSHYIHCTCPDTSKLLEERLLSLWKLVCEMAV